MKKDAVVKNIVNDSFRFQIDIRDWEGNTSWNAASDVTNIKFGFEFLNGNIDDGRNQGSDCLGNDRNTE